MKKFLSLCSLSLVLITLTACQKAADAPTSLPKIPQTGAKTVAYYVSHFDEATTIKAECDRFSTTELSLMTAAQKKAFQDTPSGINCRNAEDGYNQGWINNRIREQNKHTDFK